MPGETIYNENFDHPKGKNAYLVFVIGGLTYGEIAAIRYIGRHFSNIDLFAPNLL